ncbi:MAG: cell division protein FtsZ, partial [Pseudomonadota bacterium]
ENRARLAAEAAISNPLLDSSSMKGARGLLISITGGADLTLFEVDEAASRIREEVDEDANIILGATFDESLDGVIRVSVVATGVERNAAGKPIGATVQAVAPAAVPPASAPAAAKPVPHAQVQARQKIEQELALPTSGAAPRAAQQGPKRAASDPAVTIKPMRPAASAAAPSIESDLEAGFRAALESETQVPSQPSPVAQMQTPSAAPRMPRVEEFPPVAQAEMAAHRAPEGVSHDERTAMGLLKRLTTGLVGEKAALTGGAVPEDRLDYQAAPQPQQQAAPAVAPAPSAGVVPGAEAYAPQARRQQAPVTDNFQPQQAALDAHGRVDQRPMHDEDQLEIPAFLRRQAN